MLFSASFQRLERLQAPSAHELCTAALFCDACAGMKAVRCLKSHLLCRLTPHAPSSAPVAGTAPSWTPPRSPPSRSLVVCRTCCCRERRRAPRQHSRLLQVPGPERARRNRARLPHCWRKIGQHKCRGAAPLRDYPASAEGLESPAPQCSLATASHGCPARRQKSPFVWCDFFRPPTAAKVGADSRD